MVLEEVERLTISRLLPVPANLSVSVKQDTVYTGLALKQNTSQYSLYEKDAIPQNYGFASTSF